MALYSENMRNLKGSKMAKLKNRNPKMVEILDYNSPRFKCKKCGQIWFPEILAEGRFAPGSWQCPAGCKNKIGIA